MRALSLIGSSFVLLALWCSPAVAETILNVSYDPTRELYQEINTAFVKSLGPAGAGLTIQQSHGGSGKQARSIIEGLEADVATLALGYDIDQIAKAGLLDPNWKSKFPHNSAPYTSTIIFLVRKGNPKQIKDWDDLTRADVKVITPNPKTSGGARWNYLAAWGYALRKNGGSQQAAKEFVSKLFKNVPILDTGARAATTTFVERGIGDVLISWENEALLAVHELGADRFDIVVPSVSIRAEPPVAIVDTYAAKHATQTLAKKYLDFLYSEEGQRIIEKHYFRAWKSYGITKFPQIELFDVESEFGGWEKAHQEHFADDGIFDLIFSQAS
ncbi:MAG: sulfate ABC transporter substrate-binding protein [Deltaproteobacteria bacterium]|nr:sulfate ABC transporter substrate-binding protein [Deltaproteobacteria bacterium]